MSIGEGSTRPFYLAILGIAMNRETVPSNSEIDPCNPLPNLSSCGSMELDEGGSELSESANGHTGTSTPSISLPTPLLNDLDRAARSLDLRRSQVIRDAIQLWLSVNRDRIRAREQYTTERVS